MMDLPDEDPGDRGAGLAGGPPPVDALCRLLAWLFLIKETATAVDEGASPPFLVPDDAFDEPTSAIV